MTSMCPPLYITVYTCGKVDCMTGMYPSLSIPAYQVYPVISAASEWVQLDSSVEREEVLHCAGVSSCLRTIGEITTNHPGDGEDDHDDEDKDDDTLTYLYPLVW